MDLLKKFDLMTLVYWILRIGLAFTFLGHGILAIQVKSGWLPYLTTIGLSGGLAMTLMPIIGILDLIVFGFLIIKPVLPVLIWALIWTLLTTLIRPFAGEEIWVVIERGAIWSTPIALVLMHYYRYRKNKQAVTIAEGEANKAT
jgi:hypothetical protein